MTLDDLRHANLRALDEMYGCDKPVAVPTGRYRGVYLQPVEGADASRLANRVMVRVGFRTIPFGLDFDARCWWFGLPQARISRFEPKIDRSRWRPATVVRLGYDVSRLPAFVRRHLYDEVKPLGPALCLGIGGLNRPAGQGALFYFALVPS